MQNYLTSECNLSIEEKKFMFKCRTSDLDIRGNRKWKYDRISCISCNDETKPEIQSHLMVCEKLREGNTMMKYNSEIKYDSIFNGNTSEKIKVMRILKHHFEKRKKYLEN